MRLGSSRCTTCGAWRGVSAGMVVAAGVRRTVGVATFRSARIALTRAAVARWRGRAEPDPCGVERGERAAEPRCGRRHLGGPGSGGSGRGLRCPEVDTPEHRREGPVGGPRVRKPTFRVRGPVFRSPARRTCDGARKRELRTPGEGCCDPRPGGVSARAAVTPGDREALIVPESGACGPGAVARRPGAVARRPRPKLPAGRSRQAASGRPLRADRFGQTAPGTALLAQRGPGRRCPSRAGNASPWPWRSAVRRSRCRRPCPRPGGCRRPWA